MSEARGFLEELLERLGSADDAQVPVPEMTPPGEHRRMCVGMATFDDYDGVWFTLQSIRLFHPEMADKLTFLVLDNHPEGPGAMSLKGLEAWIPSLRYVPFRGYRSTAVRDLIFREANADIVCCVDSHVLIAPGALAAIDRFFEDHPDSCDLIQGPLLSDALDSLATHFAPIWEAGMYGQWALDERLTERGTEPFEIGMQGLGLFACRREAWPGINPRFRGFGGEEGYLHEKVRKAGGRVLCHPAAQWAHRFTRPAGPPYRPSWEERLRNYLIGWSEVGWDITDVEAHFRDQFERIGAGSQFERVLAKSVREATNPLSFFDGIFCLNLDDDVDRWAEAKHRHEQLEIGWQVERFPAVATPENHHRGNASSFRAMVAQAARRDYRHVLILEDDAVFHEETVSVMRTVAGELANLEWDLCFLGACVWSATFPFLPGSSVLQECGPVTCTHAVVVHSRAYGRILADVPAASDELVPWLSEWVAIDQYLSRCIANGTFRALITSPRLASQPPLLAFDNADRGLAERYTI